MEMIKLAWLITALSVVITVVLTAAMVRCRRKVKSNLSKQGIDSSSNQELLIGISRQLRALDRIGERIEGLDRAFRIPRVRGGFGETLLEELLKSWLPSGSWAAQYSFSDGSRVDAVVRMGSRLVAIDSKFPLERLESWLSENQQKSGKIPSDARKTFLGHAQAISARYIRPDEGTLSFAIMYLPAENIHYRLLSDDDGSIMRECLRLNVLPVGPLSLFAYLQTVSYGLKGMRLPAEGRELRARVDRLRRSFNELQKPISVAAGHLKNLNSSWASIEKMTGRLEDSIDLLELDEKEQG